MNQNQKLGLMVGGFAVFAMVVMGGVSKTNQSSLSAAALKSPTANVAQKANPVSPAIPSCLPTTTPYIIVTSPTLGTNYNTGQQMSIQWRSCNVQNVWIELGNGGHGAGLVQQTTVPASQGTFTWTIPNIIWVQQGINKDYWIGISSSSAPYVLGKSALFNIY